MNAQIKLRPQAKVEAVKFFPEFNATVGLNAKDRNQFGKEIGFEQVFVELMKRNFNFADTKTKEQLLSFKEARIDFRGNLYMFN